MTNPPFEEGNLPAAPRPGLGPAARRGSVPALRPDRAPVAPLPVADQVEPHPPVVGLRLVAEQLERPGVVAERQVGPAVVIVVANRQPAADVLLPEVTPGLLRHLPEPP